MRDDLDLRGTLRFLGQLKQNNNREWFEKNREQYEEAMAQFELLVGRLISDIGKSVDLDGITPRDCIMRIYRDVRFSKDKSPYKTGLGAGIVPGGRKSGRMGFHLHVGPGGATMVGSGLWEPTPQQLTRFRNAISEDAGAFRRIVAAAPFKRHFGEVMGDRLKTAPQGYPADHPAIELLRLKQVCVAEKFDDDTVVSRAFPGLAVESMKVMRPFIAYLEEVARGA